MKVSLVIPTYNKYQRLSMTLLSLANQTYSYEDYEIIIVDDGSEDNTKKEIETFTNKNPKINITYMYQENKGRAIARNVGVKSARGELIIFVDDDRMVIPTFIEEHAKSHMESENKRIVVLGKRMNLFLSRFEEQYEEIKAQYIKGNNYLYRKSREEYYWRKVKSVINTSIEWIMFATGNVSIIKNVLLEEGGFNEEFIGWGLEDTELGYRLFKQSVRIVINENAINYHIEHARDRTKREFEVNSNHLLFYSIHSEPPVKLFREFVEGKISLQYFKNQVDEKEIDNKHDDEVFHYSAARRF